MLRLCSCSCSCSCLLLAAALLDIFITPVSPAFPTIPSLSLVSVSRALRPLCLAFRFSPPRQSQAKTRQASPQDKTASHAPFLHHVEGNRYRDQGRRRRAPWLRRPPGRHGPRPDRGSRHLEGVPDVRLRLVRRYLLRLRLRLHQRCQRCQDLHRGRRGRGCQGAQREQPVPHHLHSLCRYLLRRHHCW